MKTLWADDIITQAMNKKLHENIQWKRLLHYQYTNQSYLSRSHDGKNFFFSKNGRKNPREELAANLNEFIHSKEMGDSHPACLFPARYKWLRKELGAEILNFNFQQCTKLNNYTYELNVQSVSLVFVSAMMRVPASMFGHTFLKLNSHNDGKTGDDFTLSYVAEVNASWFMDYAIKGITGGFNGILDYQLFDYRVRYYNFHENRSMWEFRLKFTREELERLTDHLWEIRSSDLKYYFMSENCAYYNAYFLEVAKPDLEIIRKSDIFVFPTETIKNLLSNKDILDEAYYHPANILNFETGYNTLSMENRFLLFNWNGVRKGIEFNNLKQPDIFLNTVRYKAFIEAYDEKMVIKPTNYNLINETEKLMTENQVKPNVYAEPDFTNPSVGHRPFMISMMAGESNGAFLDLSIRPVYHDKYDSPLGFAPYSELSGLKTTIRYDFNTGKPRLQQFDFIRLLSITPITADIFNVSTRVGGWLHLPDKDDIGVVKENEYSLNFENGYGLSFKFPFRGAEFAWYTFANYSINLSWAYEDIYRLSLFAESGILWYPFDWVTVLLNMQFGYYIPYQSLFWNTEGALNILFNENFSIMAIVNYDFLKSRISYQAGLRVYF
jgi:hypothetical protein